MVTCTFWWFIHICQHLTKKTQHKLKKLTKSSDVPNLSNSKDWIREIWTPISLCIPEHSMQVKMPKLVESHVGSAQLENKDFNQSPRKGLQWW